MEPLEMTNELLTITAGYTPSTSIHLPESNYCRYYWVPFIGPSAWITWGNLVAWLPDTPGPSVDINYDQLAASVGIRPKRLGDTLKRIEKFRLATFGPSELLLQRAAPTLSNRMLRTLAETCPTLAAAHEYQATAVAA
jgi:hypothetical protein